jgi:hypothetical protein
MKRHIFIAEHVPYAKKWEAASIGRGLGLWP